MLVAPGRPSYLKKFVSPKYITRESAGSTSIWCEYQRILAMLALGGDGSSVQVGLGSSALIVFQIPRTPPLFWFTGVGGLVAIGPILNADVKHVRIGRRKRHLDASHAAGEIGRVRPGAVITDHVSPASVER